MTDTGQFSFEKFEKVPIVAIIRGKSSEVIHRIAEAYLETGFTTLEVTLNTVGAPSIIASLRKSFPTLNIGAGTICNMQDLETALTAGAQFIVTPIVNEDVIVGSKERDIPIFPGAYTPTEIYKAWSLGASAVKVFPATLLGPQFISDVLAPLNGIRLIPTAGVDLGNIRSFFKAGAYGVGMGDTLLDDGLIVRNDFEGLKAFMKEFLNAIENCVADH